MYENANSPAGSPSCTALPNLANLEGARRNGAVSEVPTTAAVVSIIYE